MLEGIKEELLLLSYQNLTILSKITVTNFTILKTNISLIPYNIIRIIITATADDRNTFAIGKFIINGYPLKLGTSSLLCIGISTFLGNVITCGTNEHTNLFDSTSITTGSMIL